MDEPALAVNIESDGLLLDLYLLQIFKTQYAIKEQLFNFFNLQYLWRHPNERVKI
ncbi:hypothetical protein MNBD_GAMMA24-2300 [hydrothermal vent metagenome]|uniref:Uncharacterized protein n=1 Tax=hydrothermal vent metagenome TaxID=652676 RepID=A0A3B1BIY4_9ZZZZ